MSATPQSRATSWIWLSIAAAVTTILLKSIAAYVSASVGLLSDAMESVVNLVAAVVTMFALRWSEAPPDDDHPYGHAKGELLAVLLEGVLVFTAGIAIFWTSTNRLLHPIPLESAPLGILLSALATVVNAGVGLTLLRVGKKIRSSGLQADGHHLLTDVWTSVAVMVGLGLVTVTHVSWLDPAAAALVALFVLYTGFKILRGAVGGLVDTRLGPVEQALVEEALTPFREDGVEFAAIRTRQAGKHMFINLIVRVPGSWSVVKAHTLADRVEQALATALEHAIVDTHVEPLDAPNPLARTDTFDA